jgi:predicted  nucleic acid-binding Zn-ribbon protein
MASIRPGITETSRRADALRSEIATAEGRIATLPADIARLSRMIPSLESGLMEWRQHLTGAEKLRADYEASYQDFIQHAPPADRIADAERELRGKPIRTIAEQFYGPAKLEILVLERKSARKYVLKRDKFLANRRLLAEDVLVAQKVVNGAEAQLADARTELARATSQLAHSRDVLENAPARLASAQQQLSKLQADLTSLAPRLAAAESAEQRRLAGSKARVERDRKMREEAKQVAQSPQPWIRPNGFSRLPRPVQTMILAEAAGIDLDLGLSPDDRPTVLANVLPDSPRSYVHNDGRGVTHVQGKQTLVQRANGPSSLYTRDGDWESHEMSHGVWGMRHYDDFREVTRFDYTNPHTGIRTIGEQPYPENDFGQGWSQRMRAW